MLAEALFVATNALAILLAARLVRRCLPDADRTTRILGGLVAFVATTELSLFLLGIFGWVAPLPQAGVVLVLCILERLCPPASSSPGTHSSSPESETWSRTTWAAMTLVAALSLWWISTLLVLGVGFAWDDLAYHAPIVAWWMQSGTLSVPPFNYQSYYPLNAELHALWFTLPSGLDAHGNVATLSWMALIVSGFFAITRSLKHSTALAALLVCGVLLSPKVRVAMSWYVLNDHAMAGCVLAMLALAWNPSAPGAPPKRALGRAFLCGLAGGLAVGTKPVVAPIVVIVGLVWLFNTRRCSKLDLLRHGGAYALGVFLLGSFWYIRNWLLTGNPIFPAAVGPFEGPFGAPAQYSTSLSSIIAKEGGELGFWLELLRERLNWPLPLGILSMLGYLVGGWALFRDRDPSRRIQRLLLISVGLLYLFQFPFQPFSGTANRPEAPILHVVRYLLMPFLIGLVLLPSALSRWIKSEPAGSSKPSGLPKWSAPVITLALLALLASSTEYKAQAERRAAFDRSAWPIRAQMYAIENLPPGSKIATLSHDPSSHAMLYLLYGRQLQHEPVALAFDGTPRRHLHLTWRRRPRTWWWEFRAQPTKIKLLRNLLETDIDYILVSKWPKQEKHASWPFSRQALVEGLEREARVYADDFSEIWHLKGKRKSRRSTRTPDEPK